MDLKYFGSCQKQGEKEDAFWMNEENDEDDARKRQNF